MAIPTIVLLVAFIGSIFGAPTDDAQIYKDFEVVPKVISAAPAAKIDVKYGDLNVVIGNELTPTQVQDKPTVSYDAEDKSYYTLIMVDPDIPPEAGAKEVQHWLVVNIPGNDISKGETLFDYIGSAPPKGSGLHRYVFLVYKQNVLLEEKCYADLKDDKMGKMTTRLATTLDSLTSKLGLGEPIAGNFFRAQYDDNVPKFADEMDKKFA